MGEEGLGEGVGRQMPTQVLMDECINEASGQHSTVCPEECLWMLTMRAACCPPRDKLHANSPVTGMCVHGALPQVLAIPLCSASAGSECKAVTLEVSHRVLLKL